MNPNPCPDGAGFDDLPLGLPSATIDYTPDFLNQGFDEEITTIQQPPINIGSESYHGGMGHFHQEFANFQRPFMDHPIRFDFQAAPCFTAPELPGNIGSESYQGGMGHFDQEFTNFPSPLTDQNLGSNFPHLLDHSILSDPQAAPCFTTPELPGNIDSDQDSGMIFESGLGFTESLRLPRVAPISNNPLPEIVQDQAATSSSLGQTRRATSSCRTYKKFSHEDVRQLILAVQQYGTRWNLIAQIPSFKKQGRTDLQLLNKWRDMTKDADINRKDPEMKDLYFWAKCVDDAGRQEKMN